MTIQTSDSVVSVVANAEEEPFYFTCPVLQATLKSTTCAQARAVKNKNIQHASTKQCFGCKDFAEHHTNMRISVAEYHAKILKETNFNKTGMGYVSQWRQLGHN